MPLKIVIVGAGIAGLVAAISLRLAGHNVIVLEQYDTSTSSVVGAALNVTPNGNRVLVHIGFDATRARACRPHHWDALRGSDLKQLTSMPLAMAPGHPQPGTITIHRGDLHQELQRLAAMDEINADGALWGPPLDIRPRSRVQNLSEDGMGVVLESGEEVRGDLIVGADGAHSVVREYVARESGSPVHSGMAAFRFLLKSETLREDDELASFLDIADGVVNLLADTTETAQERHMVWYACQNGELQNFVGIHPSTSPSIEDTSEELKTAMVAEFGHFDPRIRKIISMSSHIKRWPLLIHDPLPTWVRGHVLLIGDAAHPMLPFTGQGASQAMEDGAALGSLLKDHKDMDLDHILSSFQTVRKNRTARVQILSSVRAGQETQVTEKLAPYLDETVPVAPASLIERVQHDFSYDVYAACEKFS